MIDGAYQKRLYQTAPKNYFRPSRSNVFCVPKICKLWFPVPLVLLLKWVLNKISQTVLPRLWVIRFLYFSNFLSRWRQRGKESRASIRCLTARRRRPGLTVVSPFWRQLFSCFESCVIPLVFFVCGHRPKPKELLELLFLLLFTIWFISSLKGI